MADKLCGLAENTNIIGENHAAINVADLKAGDKVMTCYFEPVIEEHEETRMVYPEDAWKNIDWENTDPKDNPMPEGKEETILVKTEKWSDLVEVKSVTKVGELSEGIYAITFGSDEFGARILVGENHKFYVKESDKPVCVTVKEIFEKYGETSFTMYGALGEKGEVIDVECKITSISQDLEEPINFYEVVLAKGDVLVVNDLLAKSC